MAEVLLPKENPDGHDLVMWATSDYVMEVYCNTCQEEVCDTINVEPWPIPFSYFVEKIKEHAAKARF